MRVCTVAIVITSVGFACLGGGVRAQEAPPSQSTRPVTESAERIARELWAVGDPGPTEEQGRPLFRTSVTVAASQFALPLPWQETDPALGRFRPRGRLYHQEFLSVVTPEAFRGGALATGGVGVDPGTMFDGVTKIWRNWQARRVRERIEREVAQLRSGATTTPP